MEIALGTSKTSHQLDVKDFNFPYQDSHFYILQDSLQSQIEPMRQSTLSSWIS